ncbi:MAG: cysteine-rich CWC family protein [Bacteroidia bacterium]|nr:cysteine-rich CWC family protein [Bacteroidia bacterium]
MKVEFCAKCNLQFFCNADNIIKCQCLQIKLCNEALNYIKNTYKSCLCLDCLTQINNSFLNAKK